MKIQKVCEHGENCPCQEPFTAGEKIAVGCIIFFIISFWAGVIYFFS